MSHENQAVADFKEFMKERKEAYKKRMQKLETDLAEGKAGMVNENGQWYLKDGSEATFNEILTTQKEPVAVEIETAETVS